MKKAVNCPHPQNPRQAFTTELDRDQDHHPLIPLPPHQIDSSVRDRSQAVKKPTKI